MGAIYDHDGASRDNRSTARCLNFMLTNEKSETRRNCGCNCSDRVARSEISSVCSPFLSTPILAMVIDTKMATGTAPVDVSISPDLLHAFEPKHKPPFVLLSVDIRASVLINCCFSVDKKKS